MLSAPEIRDEIERGRIVIDPAPALGLLKEVSVDFRLSGHFWVCRLPQDVAGVNVSVDATLFDPYDPSISEHREVDSIELPPHGYVIGRTVERLSLPLDICGWIEGKSGRARQGLVVHLTAPKIDPGWGLNGPKEITLEIVNHFPLPMTLRAGMPIAQMVFHRLGAANDSAYGGKHGALG